MKNKSIKKQVGRPIGTGSGKKLTGTNIKIKGALPGEDPILILHPPEKEDFEKVSSPPKDELSNHPYPPPKKNLKFRKIWGQFVDSITRRDNFNLGHLNTLQILCDLFVEYDELDIFIRTKGRSYQSFGRSGVVWKLYPEVTHMKSVQHQINVYIKQLGLNLQKDAVELPNGSEEDWT